MLLSESPRRMGGSDVALTRSLSLRAYGMMHNGLPQQRGDFAPIQYFKTPNSGPPRREGREGGGGGQSASSGGVTTYNATAGVGAGAAAAATTSEGVGVGGGGEGGVQQHGRGRREREGSFSVKKGRQYLCSRYQQALQALKQQQETNTPKPGEPGYIHVWRDRAAVASQHLPVKPAKEDFVLQLQKALRQLPARDPPASRPKQPSPKPSVPFSPQSANDGGSGDSADKGRGEGHQQGGSKGLPTIPEEKRSPCVTGVVHPTTSTPLNTSSADAASNRSTPPPPLSASPQRAKDAAATIAADELAVLPMAMMSSSVFDKLKRLESHLSEEDYKRLMELWGDGSRGAALSDLALRSSSISDLANVVRDKIRTERERERRRG
ncbi:unnamed protein product [Vitrella brassicaformis CCMP3155]|uniref:Uncharacterized protein n=1 Tax=Vitrella brassicaformis (strain CCMP3155) TaxID=1169540 RepID=A0A0G4FBW8_VITBC|nr:unnamed protein product [Vitrella brassicaformis CCMP3155]|eukprot:CEM10116.1 unnamed protein product [Vitrella brassicaformis CCMP3155]